MSDSNKTPIWASEQRRMTARLLPEAIEALGRWQLRWPDYEIDATLRRSEAQMREVLYELLERLTENYPFFHPDYAGQMLKPPHAVATMAYFLAQQINPNNHALDGGPATAKMEYEVVADLARMFGYDEHLGHLTSSGTIANLEALWVARQLHPDSQVAFSREAHYTHSRMCEVLGIDSVAVEVDARGRMDLDDLRDKLRAGRIGTVVMTTGTTAIGAVDPVDEALGLRREFDFRIHVDAAYGGFFRLLADDDRVLESRDASAFRAIAESDSIVVDPHKHGLQPYGCGSVIFRDPAVGRFYRHDSPYTYFTSKDLHLGEISLECSRAGAAAAALWATLRCFPLSAEAGLGAVLRQTRAAACEWARLLRGDDRWRLVVDPSLDIVTFYPATPERTTSSISAVVEDIFERTMNDEEDPVYLAKFQVKRPLASGDAELIWDAAGLTALRSVLMKPEHLAGVASLHARVMRARGVTNDE
ncbi:MAG: aminotransferase class V-fold PLP-dependent enzyme [Blastocatellales bacterium]|nr:aminotransferase class V-fold PLP-dependent enzyme [Blastocatellales bacterium]